MAYIYRDGKVYEQTISEVEVDIAAEQYKLQAWKDAIVVDANAHQEYLDKVAEIEALKIDDSYKDKLKQSIQFYSGSGIKQAMVDEVQAKVDAVKAVVADATGIIDAEIKL